MTGKPYIIGIAGGSCCGKTYMARHLAEKLSKTTIIQSDAYYTDLSHIKLEERATLNFDVPDAIEYNLLVEHIRKLADDISIEQPIYDFSTHTRTIKTRAISPTPYIIVEGLYVLYWKDLRQLFNTSVFVEADDKLCMQRRIDRDTKERGRTVQSVLNQYDKTVRPMFIKHILPTSKLANLIVSGSDDIEKSTETVMKILKAIS